VDQSIEQEIRLEFIDIASLHTFNSEHSAQFFEKLKDCEDFSLFEQVAIKKLIEFKWPLAREFTIRKLMVPYLIFMATYLVYMNWFYRIRNEPGNEIMNYCFIGVLAYFCWYFFLLEMIQFKDVGFKYLASMWNYLDLIPPIALLVFLPLEFVGYFDYNKEA